MRRSTVLSLPPQLVFPGLSLSMRQCFFSLRSKTWDPLPKTIYRLCNLFFSRPSLKLWLPFWPPSKHARMARWENRVSPLPQCQDPEQLGLLGVRVDPEWVVGWCPERQILECWVSRDNFPTTTGYFLLKRESLELYWATLLVKLEYGNPYWMGRISTVYVFVLNSLDKLIFILKKDLPWLHNKYLRRSTAPSLPLEYVVYGWTILSLK
jgi:hypothetical protein